MVMAGADFIKTAASGGFWAADENCAVRNYTAEELEALADDQIFATAIGQAFVDQFTAIKEVELTRYLEAVGDEASARDRVTDWETAWYLPYL
jgi:glutamine synthetase